MTYKIVALSKNEVRHWIIERRRKKKLFTILIPIQHNIGMPIRLIKHNFLSITWAQFQHFVEFNIETIFQNEKKKLKNIFWNYINSCCQAKHDTHTKHPNNTLTKKKNFIQKSLIFFIIWFIYCYIFFKYLYTLLLYKFYFMPVYWEKR